VANKTQPFRQFHVTRALRGAVAAGLRDPHVELHPDGKIVVGASGAPDTPVVRKPAAAVVLKPVKVRPSAPPRGIRPSR
jgi:hypothetical protein